jgi:hypothetical protein
MSINVELIDKIITQIKAEPKLFKMGDWQQTVGCGTAACIAGWAWTLTKPENFRWMGYSDWPEVAAAMGIDEITAHKLFLMPRNITRRAFDELPAEERANIAADALENLKATGKADWEQSLIKFGHDDLLDDDRDDDDF